MRERKPQIFEESLVRRWRRGCAAHCTCLSQCSADCVGWARVSDHVPLSVSPAFTFDFVIFCSVYMCVYILSCCHIKLFIYAHRWCIHYKKVGSRVDEVSRHQGTHRVVSTHNCRPSVYVQSLRMVDNLIWILQIITYGCLLATCLSQTYTTDFKSYTVS